MTSFGRRRRDSEVNLLVNPGSHLLLSVHALIHKIQWLHLASLTVSTRTETL